MYRSEDRLGPSVAWRVPFAARGGLSRNRSGCSNSLDRRFSPPIAVEHVLPQFPHPDCRQVRQMRRRSPRPGGSFVYAQVKCDEPVQTSCQVRHDESHERVPLVLLDSASPPSRGGAALAEIITNPLVVYDNDVKCWADYGDGHAEPRYVRSSEALWV